MMSTVFTVFRPGICLRHPNIEWVVWLYVDFIVPFVE